MSKYPTPVEVLEERLRELRSAKRHSLQAFKDDLIDIDTHNGHIINLDARISVYKKAIEILVDHEIM
jgi:hypothetical protein